ncbi:phenylacetate--CoA ligase family protein [Rummeliibacillus pycnus]|uniref:phenylacetate--CoA ligase family protein n=1 Tax=Rummeliibacillus pycnus TaxID=101070 RepID=UPI000C9B1032|nr:AMP-binding protein [Rummeliibacillus pycnus]
MSNKFFIEKALKSKFYQQKLVNVNLEDWSNIPFTTKSDLRNVDTYDVLGTNRQDIATYHETSGTTGTPTPSWFSYNDIQQEADVLLRSDLKLNENDLILNRFPFAVALPAFILYWAAEKAHAGHIGVDQWSQATPLKRVVEIINRTSPTILALGPTEAVKLYQTGKQMGQQFPVQGLRALILGGELVSPARKKYIEKLWGVPVYLLFGSTETGGLFVTCQAGHYHLNHPQVKIEAVDDNGHPVRNNTIGNCVISSGREGMPLLRYYNNDRIEIREAKMCSCGDDNPIVVHYGRQDDAITINNRVISLYEIQEAVYALSLVPFMWNLRYEHESIVFILQYLNTINCGPIQKELSDLLGMDVSIELQDIIPIETLTEKPAFGKYSYVKKFEDAELVTH